MNQYTYHIRDQAGNAKTGLVEASDQRQAVQILRERGFVIVSVTQSNNTLNLDKAFQRFDKVSQTEITNFTRQLSTMITAGLSIIEALTILKNQTTQKNFAQSIESVLRDIEGGSTLADS